MTAWTDSTLFGLVLSLLAYALGVFLNRKTKLPLLNPLLIAVTQLTSTSEQMMQEELLIPRPMEEVVARYAQNAQNSGLDGVVCSPLEAKAVKEACSQAFLTVTPGVRFADDDVGDQKRVTTPARARALGSDYIVVGRSITAAADPVAAYRRAVKDFVEGEEA